MSTISYRFIRRIIADFSDYDVSSDTLSLLQSQLELLIRNHINVGIKEFDEYNKLREIQGFKPLQRLPPKVFENKPQELLKPNKRLINCTIGQISNKDTIVLNKPERL